MPGIQYHKSRPETDMPDLLKIALAGNPNSGKTTIFNRLTHTHQHVGNYPGVTVDILEGSLTSDGHRIRLIDLPGTYALTAHSEEELVARNFLIREKPDVVIDVLDASSLERHLYLAIQLIELGVPLVLAFNMTDMAERAGLKFDIDLLEELLGVPIVRTTGTSGEGLDELLRTAIGVASGTISAGTKSFSYGRDLNREIAAICRCIETEGANPFENLSSRWVAIKLLENDEIVRDEIEKTGKLSEHLVNAIDEAHARLQQIFASTPEVLFAEARYGIISGAASEAVVNTVEERHDTSDRIDSILINPLLGLPIFLVMMYLVFMLTFKIGEPIMGLLEIFFGWLGNAVYGLWPEGSESPLRSLLVEGVIGGVGGVLTFVPNILLLFIAIAVLEDSGYMARAAFIMDKLMHRIGLHGKSFIPMMIGFGCSVPAILGTRILENRRDRLVTILVIPLMSCGARFPIYALIIPAFFPPHLRGPMLWLIYIIGIALAVLLTKLLRATMFRGESSPFVMELPPYRLPTLQGLAIHSWDRCSHYLKKAGTVILAISIVLWFLSSFPAPREYSRDYEAMLSSAQTLYSEGLSGIASELDYSGPTDALDQAIQTALDEGDVPLSETGSINTSLFITNVVDIQALRTEFNRTVSELGLDSESPEYILLDSEFQARLDSIVEEYPETASTAMDYLDSVRAPYIESTSSISSSIRREELTASVLGRITYALDPLLKPMGFDWKIGTALFGALAAKEVFVAQLGIVYAVSDADEDSATLRSRLQQDYNPLIGFCLMLFTLISAPCVATIAATRAETGSWKWAFLQFFGLTAIAWIITTIVYQLGSVMGIGG